MIGEIGGNMEANAARWVKEHGTKPVVGFIAGQTAPKGRTMGHAGAIVGGKDDTAEAKMAIMRECGIEVVNSPADIGDTMARLMGKSPAKSADEIKKMLEPALVEYANGIGIDAHVDDLKADTLAKVLNKLGYS